MLVDLQRGPMSRSKHSSSLGTDCYRSEDYNNLSLRTLIVEESPLMSGLARLVSYTVQYVDIYILKLDNRQGILCRSGCIPTLIEHTLDSL